jgi:hypothetical protein
LLFHHLQPCVFAGGLIKMTVDADVFVLARHGAKVGDEREVVLVFRRAVFCIRA